MNNNVTKNSAGDDLPDVSDDEFEQLEISFASTIIDLTMEEDIDVNLVEGKFFL